MVDGGAGEGLSDLLNPQISLVALGKSRRFVFKREFKLLN